MKKALLQGFQITFSLDLRKESQQLPSSLPSCTLLYPLVPSYTLLYLPLLT